MLVWRDWTTWKQLERLQQLTEVILVIHVSILVKTPIVTQAENVMKSILLPELPTHAVHSERLLVLQQSLLEMSLACNDQSS